MGIDRRRFMRVADLPGNRYESTKRRRRAPRCACTGLSLPRFSRSARSMGTWRASNTVLARGRLPAPPLRARRAPVRQDNPPGFDPEVELLVADILSDPDARSLEFGRRSILALPRPMAVKTGTSNDYRDAWAVGFSDRYTVGVWMGNVDRRSMREVTGSVGPGVVVMPFASSTGPKRRSLSSSAASCARCPSAARAGSCPAPPDRTMMEWFDRTMLHVACPLHGGGTEDASPLGQVALRVQQPSPGLHLALDPRIPDELERFELRLAEAPAGSSVEWFVDDASWSTSVAKNGAALWMPSPVGRSPSPSTSAETSWGSP